ncbi:MAG: ABC transporter substrate-binding protein, partial [Chloroflexi bacterium]|nr:ABC transporter substrate-binding protein [Chloroflexota bacterium]
MKKIGFVLLLVMVVVALVISGCGKQPITPTAPATIKVGVLVSLTGFDAAIGMPAKNGYEL